MKAWVLFVASLVACSGFAARLFVTASSMSGSTTTLPGAPIVEPLTLSCWCKPTVTNVDYVLMSLATNIGAGSASRRQISVLGSSGFSGQLSADAFDATTRVLGPALVAGSWYHVAAVCVSTTERILYVNGSAYATNTTAPTTPFSGHLMFVGMRYNGSTYGHFADARIAEVALWNVALSSSQVASLGAGKDPRLVSSTAPLVYWPMLGEASPEVPYCGAVTLKLTNSPTKGDHPPVARP